MQGSKKINARDVTTPDTLMDLIRQTVPPNIVQVSRGLLSQILRTTATIPRTNLPPLCVQATMQQYRTALVRPGCQDEECSAFRDEDGHLRDPADPLTWKFKGGK